MAINSFRNSLYLVIRDIAKSFKDVLFILSLFRYLSPKYSSNASIRSEEKLNLDHPALLYHLNGRHQRPQGH